MMQHTEAASHTQDIAGTTGKQHREVIYIVASSYSGIETAQSFPEEDSTIDQKHPIINIPFTSVGNKTHPLLHIKQMESIRV